MQKKQSSQIKIGMPYDNDKKRPAFKQSEMMKNGGAGEYPTNSIHIFSKLWCCYSHTHTV